MAPQESRTLRDRAIDGLRFLRGPRFIDLPLRAVILVIAILSAAPIVQETEAFPYQAFIVIGSGLMLVSIWFPIAGATLAAVAFFAFHGVFPDMVNPFDSVAIVASAVAVSYAHYWVFACLSAVALSLVNLAMVLDASSSSGPVGVVSVFMWLVAAALAWTAGALERQIRREIERRVQEARDHASRVERIRLGFALDAHDTVSHGLATQAAMIRVLARSSRPHDDHQRIITELAISNASTQRQLRGLLQRLGRDPVDDGEVPFEVDFRQAGAGIQSAARAAEYGLTVRIGEIPAEAHREFAETANFILQELATNMVKHAARTEGCRIEVETEQLSRRQNGLVFTASNSITSDAQIDPYSLQQRVQLAGGNLSLAVRAEGSVTITVRIPFRDKSSDKIARSRDAEADADLMTLSHEESTRTPRRRRRPRAHRSNPAARDS